MRDLCAIFPRSREIEAEAVSLGLPMERMPHILPAIEDAVEKVNASDGATEAGREAINASSADLAHQRGLAEEAKQSAYFLVDFANFARAGVKHLRIAGRIASRKIGDLGVDGWRAVRRGAPRGIERGAVHAGKALIVGGIAALMHALGSDIAALGSMVGAYAPLHEILQHTIASRGAPTSDTAPIPDFDATSAPADDLTEPAGQNPPAPRAAKPRRTPTKASSRKRRK